MHLALLELTDFRSYEHAELELEPGPTTFIGRNGQGKTNLMEAVGYVATLGSHRVAADAPLIRLGAERAVIRAGIVRDDRRVLVQIEMAPGRADRVRVNRNPLARPRDVLGALQCVLFAPEDLAVVKGDPAERRGFLDELLVALTPRLAAVRADYERALKQRNALLKTAGPAIRAGRGDQGTLEVWDAHMARHGAELLAARLALVAALAPLVDKTYQAVSAGDGPAGLAYRSSLGPDVEGVTERGPLEAALLGALVEARPRELDRGVSLIGPHRDDLVISLGPLPTRGYASHGESWSLALALRLAAYELLRSTVGTDPVLILDDVFAELDAGRRARLAAVVAPAEQVLVTAAVDADVPSELAGVRYEVRDGRVGRI